MSANATGSASDQSAQRQLIAQHARSDGGFFHCNRTKWCSAEHDYRHFFHLPHRAGVSLATKPLTTLDHRPNFAPWKALEEKGVIIRVVYILESDYTLDLHDLKRKLSPKTKVVAVTYASNAVGTINPVAEITRLAHWAGAMAYIDAVHYGPHGLIDVKAINCDFGLSYKFLARISSLLQAQNTCRASCRSEAGD